MFALEGSVVNACSIGILPERAPYHELYESGAIASDANAGRIFLGGCDGMLASSLVSSSSSDSCGILTTFNEAQYGLSLLAIKAVGAGGGSGKIGFLFFSRLHFF